jgi:hypothetical protein
MNDQVMPIAAGQANVHQQDIGKDDDRGQGHADALADGDAMGSREQERQDAEHRQGHVL